MGGSSTETTTTGAAPNAQPVVDSALNLAQSSGSAAGQVVPWSNQTTTGAKNIEAQIRSQMYSDGVSGQYQSVMGTGGYNDAQQEAMGGIQQVGNAAMGPSYSEQNLSGIANGDMLNRQDPNFERALSAASDSAAHQVNEGAAASGRYASQNWADNMAKTVGDYEATQRVNQYNNERANQMSANSMMDSNRLQGLGLGLTAAQSGFNAGQQGFQNLGTAYEGMKRPAADLISLGSMYEDQAGKELEAPLRQAEWLMSMGAGAPGGSVSTPGPNPFATGLGYAATGLGALGSAQNLGWF